MSTIAPSPPPNASATLRGLVSLVAQTFAGVKTFTSAIIASSGIQLASLWNTNGTGASDVCVKVGTNVADGSVNAGAKIASFRTGIGGSEVEYAYLLKSGKFVVVLGAQGIDINGGSGTAGLTHNGTGFTMNSRCTNLEYWQGTLYYHTGTGFSLEAASCVRLGSDAADGPTAVAASSESTSAWSNAGAKLHRFRNNTTDVAYIDLNGAIQLNVAGAARPAASAALRGTIWYTKSAGGVADTLSVCLKSAADTYAWVTISTG